MLYNSSVANLLPTTADIDCAVDMQVKFNSRKIEIYFLKVVFISFSPTYSYLFRVTMFSQCCNEKYLHCNLTHFYVAFIYKHKNYYLFHIIGNICYILISFVATEKVAHLIHPVYWGCVKFWMPFFITVYTNLTGNLVKRCYIKGVLFIDFFKVYLQLDYYNWLKLLSK